MLLALTILACSVLSKGKGKKDIDTTEPPLVVPKKDEYKKAIDPAIPILVVPKNDVFPSDDFEECRGGNGGRLSLLRNKCVCEEGYRKLKNIERSKFNPPKLKSRITGAPDHGITTSCYRGDGCPPNWSYDNVAAERMLAKKNLACIACHPALFLNKLNNECECPSSHIPFGDSDLEFIGCLKNMNNEYAKSHGFGHDEKAPTQFPFYACSEGSGPAGDGFCRPCISPLKSEAVNLLYLNDAGHTETLVGHVCKSDSS